MTINKILIPIHPENGKIISMIHYIIENIKNLIN